jgi:(1->4)-alpha-D-glucan 1-alpha-D-glucosylmutase
MRIPIATYRLQLNYTFGFKAAKETLPYLAELGISDIYASPIFKARKGSLHGYDIVGPNELNPELGTPADFEELMEEVKKLGMGWVQDIVPNHMAFDSQNSLLMDVFENAWNSPYFSFFDVKWTQVEQAKPEVLAPFLGKFYGETLEDGEISLVFGPNGLAAKYYDFVFPLRMETYTHVFNRRLLFLRDKLGDTHSDFVRYLGALYVLQALSSPEADFERYERVKVIKKTLWDLYNENSTIKAFIDANIMEFNGTVGNPASFNLLDDLLSEQVFRLSFWKVAYEEINYRRFFSINNLISIKMEDAAVFENLHMLIHKLIREGKFSGLRVDHIDGLYDPCTYLKRLRERNGDTYIVVEKILNFQEELPEDWPIQGTTGYDFLNYVNELFCRNANQAQIDKIYTNFTGVRSSYNDLVYDKKRLIVEKHMGGEVDALARLLKRISGLDRHGRDITLYGLRRALVELLVQFPVYRTYVNEDALSESGRNYIVEAVQRSINHNPALLNEFNFLKKFFLLDFGPYISEEEKKQRVLFVMRFQQFSGPLMAKGFEDTLLYVYNRMISLNDVGGSPDKFGLSRGEFHDFGTMRASLWPHSLNATSTHDTKRGEDARARINVISEMPKEWEAHLKQWNKLNRRKKSIADNVPAPSRNDEYFLYQTLLGTFPPQADEYDTYIDRLKGYIIKVVREAKMHTAWLKPDEQYESAFLSFLEKVINPREGNPFLEQFLPFQERIAYFGIFNSLSQVLLKATAPGVPDFYQGSEQWDLSLVDPDNRRPVDFQSRKRMLADIKEKARADMAQLVRELLERKEDGRIKLFLVHRLLLARKQHQRLFQEGSYLPLHPTGPLQEHIISFARVHETNWAVVVAPRFFATILQKGENPVGEQFWQNTHIALSNESPKYWRNPITNERLEIDGVLPVGKALQRFPAGLLINEERK